MKNRFAFLTSLFIAMMIITAGAAQEQKPNQPVAPKPAAEAEATDEPVAITEKTKRVETQVQAVLTPDQFANFRPPFINDKGEIALLGLISDPASPNRVGQKMFVRGGDGKWRLLLDQGEKSVDTSIVIDTFGLPHVNASGEVTFLANGPKVADNLPVTSDPNDPASFRPLVSNQVLYKKTKDGIRSIYRMGTEVPNMPSYITGISNVTSNNVGTTAFIGTYSEPDGRGLFFVADGKVSLIARSGQKIGKNETGTFSEHYYPSSINDRNEVAFLGRSGDKSGIFIGSPRGVEIIAFGGRPTPLKGANFLGFGNRTPAINNRGDILFVGFFDGPQAGRGLFLKPVDGPIRLIARGGDASTGTIWTLADFSSFSVG
ncbi:MAG: choice-of-anchor tandem repeat NxxGxxAF-containing protein, partial [Acidobacteriota bacterium]